MFNRFAEGFLNIADVRRGAKAAGELMALREVHADLDRRPGAGKLLQFRENSLVNGAMFGDLPGMDNRRAGQSVLKVTVRMGSFLGARVVRELMGKEIVYDDNNIRVRRVR